MARQTVRIFLVLIVAFLLGSAVRAEEWPLSKDDITLLLIGGSKTDKMLALIERRGVDFKMDPDLAKKFHDQGASDEVIEALQRASRMRSESASTPFPARPASGATVANPQPSPISSGHAPQTTESSQEPSSVERKIADTLSQSETPGRTDEHNYPLAPKFRLTDLFGKSVNLADYKGKVVLLDFWATWCVPCRTEIPRFVEFQSQYQDRGLQVIGIAVDDHRWSVKRFYGEYHMNYPVAMGDSELKQIYGATRGLPTTFLIGRDGRIYAQYNGAPADLAPLERYIQSLLGSSAGKSSPTKLSASQGEPNVPSVAPVQSREIQPAAGESVPAASKAPAKPANSADLTDPGLEQIQHIVQEFAAKEKLFKEARDNYTFHQINKVEELGPDDEVVGTYRQDWDILFDDAGKRLEQVTYAPESTLKGLSVSKEDLDAMRSIQPFVLTSDELPEYDVKYMGHVKVDFLTAYVFSVRPKEIKKGRQYFKGVIWVDDRDLQIVKSEGKSVPEVKTKGGENLFPRFITYREQVDGKYWFPTYTMADDTLFFSGGPIHIKEVIRYTDYKQFKASSTIKIVTELPSDKPNNSPKSPPPKR